MKTSCDLILNNISKHISLDASEIDFFTSLLELKKLKKKQLILRSGEICKYEYFVNKGCIRTFNIDRNGFEHIGMFAIEDWYTGDLYSFMTGRPSTMNIITMEESEVLRLSKSNWEKLLDQIPKFEKLYRIKFQRAFISLQHRMMENLSDSAEERYIQFINRYPLLEQRIPQKYIAAYLGITPEFLSMIRRKFARG